MIVIWSIQTCPPAEDGAPGRLEYLKRVLYGEHLELRVRGREPLRWPMFQVPVYSGLHCGFNPSSWLNLPEPIVGEDLLEVIGPEGWWLRARGADEEGVWAFKLPTGDLTENRK